MSQYPPLRRDNVTHTYRNAAAFNQHSAQMRQAGWQIGPYTERNGKATVLWYREVPPSVAPNAFKPPAPRGGLHPLAIVGIVLASLFGLAIIGGVASGTASTATPRSDAGISGRSLIDNGTITARTTSAGSVRATSAATSSTPSGTLTNGVAGSSSNATPSASASSTIVALAPTRAADTATPTLPQVVTVKDEATNLRQAADVASAVVMLVQPGTDAKVIGEDETGPDGVTRYIHAQVGDKEGYLRSDLVSAPRAGTPAPPKVIPPTSAPAPATTPLGSGAPVRVGSGDLAVTLYRYLDPAPTGNAIGPPAGSRAVAFDIGVENLSRSSQRYNALYAYLKDSNDRRYDVNFFGADVSPQLSAGANQPGESTRGWVVFVIPSNATISQIGYEDIVTGHRIIFNYAG